MNIYSIYVQYTFLLFDKILFCLCLFFISQDFLESLKPQDLFYYFDTISIKSGESDSQMLRNTSHG